MTTRSKRFVPAGLIALMLLVCGPSSGWTQTEQQQTPASAQTGTVAVPQTVPAQAGAAAPPAPEQPVTYTIKEGDTLWDISSAHYRDPFLWPLIWKANPSITDPDLIYPGVALVIPSLTPVEQAMAEPQEAEKPVQEQAAPAPAPVAAEPAPPSATESSTASFFRKPAVESTIAEPQVAPGGKLILPKEAKQPLVDKYAMISAGFVGDESSKDRLLESVTEPSKTLMGYDDEVTINVRSRQDVKVGDRFLIYRPDHTVRHPVTGRSYGPLNLVVGILKVTATQENGRHRARITISFDDAERDDLLTPYQEPELLYPAKDKKVKDLAGNLLEVRDTRTINAQVDVVYLDKGKVDGVDPGDVFIILASHIKKADIPKVIGEVQVFLVRDRSATAVVRRSTDSLGRGDRYRFKE